MDNQDKIKLEALFDRFLHDGLERISFGISIDEAGRICYTQDNKPVNEP